VNEEKKPQRNETEHITCHKLVVAHAGFARSPTNEPHAPPAADAPARPVLPDLTSKPASMLPPMADWYSLLS
jgi:hypothetical protein